MQRCSKPGCGRQGAVVLAYDYATRRALLAVPGSGELSPHLYVLCSPCADKLRPPRGWELVDERGGSPDRGRVVDGEDRRESALAGAADVSYAR